MLIIKLLNIITLFKLFMIITVLPRYFKRFILGKGPYMCYYNNEKDVLNMIEHEILEVEKKFPVIMVLKLDYLKHKEHFKFQNDNEYKSVKVYSCGKCIANHYQPGSQGLTKMFNMCKKMHDSFISKRNQELLRREMVWENISLDDPVDTSINYNKIKYFIKIDENENLNDLNDQKIYDKISEIGCFISPTLTLNKSYQLSNNIVNNKVNNESNIQSKTLKNTRISHLLLKEQINSKIKFRQAKKILDKYHLQKKYKSTKFKIKKIVKI